MRHASLMVIVFLFLLAVGPAAAGGGPTEASLIQAWETQLRGDPSTVLLDRVGDRRYHFKTTRFPFDGELRVLNANLDESPAELGEGFTIGVVEVELAGLPRDFAEKHAYSYARWQAGNMLYFDRGASAWMSAREWQGKMARQVRTVPLLARASQYLWLVFLAALVVFVALLGRRTSRQLKTAQGAQERILADHQRSLQLVERSMQIAEDSNHVLHGILQALEARDEKA